MLPTWAITFLVVFALTGSIALLIYMLFFYRGSTGSAGAIVHEHIFDEVPDVTKLSEYVASLARQLQLHREVLQYAKARVALAVALVQKDNRFVLCNLTSGPFEGYWGFPAGYVEADNPRAAQAKADYEVEKYLGKHVNVTPMGEMNSLDEPLVLHYGELMPIEVLVFRYGLPKEPGDFDTAETRLVGQKEIEKLGAVNPIVFDVLGQLMKTVFSSEFAARMGQVKAERLKVLPIGRLLSNKRA